MSRIKEGQTVELEIDNLAGGGEGVGRWQGRAVFVPGALPGERVRARVARVKKSFARGELEEVLAPAASRIDPECRDYISCGGCDLQHLDYDAQLACKRQVVSDVLARIGKITAVPVHPVLGMPNPWHYRNKVHLQVGGERGNVTLGFFAPGSHRLVTGAGDCRLVNKQLNEVAVLLEELLNRYRVEPYHWKKRRGLLRHVVLRIGESTGEVMAVLVTSPGEWEAGRELARELTDRCPQTVSVVRNVNTKPRQVVLGDKNLVLAGQKFISDRLGGLTFRLSANSFYQVNSYQAERLYEVARKYAGLTGNETVIDAYCGIGTITLYLAGSSLRVVGLESVPGAVADAEENAGLNNIDNVEFRTGRVEKLLPALAREGLQPGVVVLDPPRAGCDKEVLTAISRMKVPRVVYVSCNPATLARDLGRMKDLGYEVKEVQPVDMFPWTGHVECIILIKRAESRMG